MDKSNGLNKNYSGLETTSRHISTGPFLFSSEAGRLSLGFAYCAHVSMDAVESVVVRTFNLSTLWHVSPRVRSLLCQLSSMPPEGNTPD